MTPHLADAGRRARPWPPWGLLWLALALCAFTAAPSALAADETRHASLLPLVQPLWSDLSPQQQAVLEPFEAQWNGWSAAEKRTWVRLADRMPSMESEARERTARRIREWASLTPEQRRIARQNYRIARRLPPEERQEQWERYRELTPEQRSVLRTSVTSNTAARHADTRTGLAKEAAQPLSGVVQRRNDQPRRLRRVH